MTMTTPREAEREAFEEFAVRKFGRGMLSRAANGPYVWDDVSDAWGIWQAARTALAAVQPARLPKLAEEGKDALRMDWLDKQRDLLFDCYMQDGKITHILRQHWGAPLGHGPTPRAAIDAAIAAMKEPT